MSGNLSSVLRWADRKDDPARRKPTHTQARPLVGQNCHSIPAQGAREDPAFCSESLVILAGAWCGQRRSDANSETSQVLTHGRRAGKAEKRPLSNPDKVMRSSTLGIFKRGPAWQAQPRALRHPRQTPRRGRSRTGALQASAGLPAAARVGKASTMLRCPGLRKCSPCLLQRTGESKCRGLEKAQLCRGRRAHS